MEFYIEYRRVRYTSAAPDDNWENWYGEEAEAPKFYYLYKEDALRVIVNLMGELWSFNMYEARGWPVNLNWDGNIYQTTKDYYQFRILADDGEEIVAESPWKLGLLEN